MCRRPTLLVLAVAVALALAAPASAQQPAALRIAIPGDDGSLTPYTFTNAYPLMTLVYDTLMWRDAGGVPQPWLARSVKRRAGGLQLVVTLRGGVRWHDGRPLTADDVAFTYEYMRTHPHPRFTPQLRELAGVKATGPLSVVFTLRKPALGFEDQPLSDVPILPRHLWQGLPRGRLAPAGLPVGSGPYRLVRHIAGRSYRFQANRDYFRGRPTVDRITASVSATPDTNLVGLRSQHFDLEPLPVRPGTSPRLQRRPLRLSLTVDFSRAVSYSGTMLEFNLTRPPFDQPAARRAVAAALDLGEIAGLATGPGGRPRADHGVLHPQSPWAASAVLHRFDAAAARVAFTEQGIGPFSVAVASGDPVRLEAARRVVAALRAVGANARLAVRDFNALNRALGNEGGKPTFAAAVVGFPALASYDPSFLRAVFGDPAGAPLNDGGYRSARFDRAADEVEQAATIATRRRAVRRELRILARDLPVVPLFFGGSTFAYRPAAYDRWVDVRGSGILDKLSFVGGVAASRQPAGPVANPTDPGGSGQISLAPFIVALAVLLLVAVAWGLRRGRTA
jgi:peptide/nickel transport system substrate-binding protein